MRQTLLSLGLTPKAIDVYLACLKLGPAPVRKIAVVAGINRGTTYDVLKSLVEAGLVSYYHQDKHQYFIAEDPTKLREVVEVRARELEATGKQIEEVIPQLQSMHDNATGKPVARYYEGFAGVRHILQDVIITCVSRGEQRYAVYSSANLRPLLYKLYPTFTDDRIKAGIQVRVIALGPGGETRGLDERKWLPTTEPTPTYQIVYPGKLAMITVDASGTPRGVTIEDANLAATQRTLFDALWQKL